MKVDVVIPAFGRPELLKEAIASVLNQTHRDLTLTVVDDASLEPLETLVDIADARLRFIRQPKTLGPGQARNHGASEGSAPLIAFLDSDDLWRPDKLEQQVRFMSTDLKCQWLHTDELWLRSGAEVKQKKEHRKEGGQFLVRAFERCLISPSAVLMRREFFEQSGGFAPHFFLCEDYELWLRLLAEAPVGYVDQPLTIKRAGNWQQLSAAREIDRYRVLALHRFYRRIRKHAAFDEYLEPLLNEAGKKSSILAKGAAKYGHADRARKYQTWLTLFNVRRTRLMR